MDGISLGSGSSNSDSELHQADLAFNGNNGAKGGDVKSVDTLSTYFVAEQSYGFKVKNLRERECVAAAGRLSSLGSDDEFFDAVDFIPDIKPDGEFFDAVDFIPDIDPDDVRCDGSDSILVDGCQSSYVCSEVAVQDLEVKSTLTLRQSGNDEGSLEGAVSLPDNEQLRAEPVSEKVTVEDDDDDDDDGGGAWNEVVSKKSKKKGRHRAVIDNTRPVGWSAERGGRVRRKETYPSEGKLADETSLFDSCIQNLERIGKNSFSRSFAINRNHFKKVNKEGEKLFFEQDVSLAYEMFSEMMRNKLGDIKKEGSYDLEFLANSFMVLLPRETISAYIVYVSLFVDRLRPNFLKLLGDSYLLAVCGFKNKTYNGLQIEDVARSFEKTYLLNNGGVERLGWEGLSMRGRCILFSTVSGLFESINRKDLIKSMMDTVNEDWLNENMHTALCELMNLRQGDDRDGAVYNLKYVSGACFQWIKLKFNDFESVEHRDKWVEVFSETVGNIFLSLTEYGECNGDPVKSLLRIIAHASVNFSGHFSRVLGYDRSIKLFQDTVNWLDKVSDVGHLVFRLRLTYIAVVLMKCEDLLLKKSIASFVDVWSQYSGEMKTVLDKCDEFLGSGGKIFSTMDVPSNNAQREGTHCSLLLKRSAFERLGCEMDEHPSVSARGKKGKYIALLSLELSEKGLSFHKEGVVLELVKWHCLAGDHERGIDLLKATDFSTLNLRHKKAELLGRASQYEDAITEFRCCKDLIPDDTQANKRKRYHLDGKIAMLCLDRYKSENKKDYLHEAFTLEVSALKCSHDSRFNCGQFIGGLSHIANEMAKSGMAFNKYQKNIASLSFLSEDEFRIKNWEHLCRILSLHNKDGFTSGSAIAKASETIGQYGSVLDTGKMPFNF